MKKLFLLLFLLPLFITAQPVRDEYFTIKGKPTIAASNTNAKSVDFTNKQVWNYTKLTNVWSLVTDTNIIKMYLGGSSTSGTNGKDAIINIGSVQTLTGAPGTPASVVITDINPNPSEATFNFNFTIPQGQQGVQGVPGTSGGSGSVANRTFITPNLLNDFGAIQVGGINTTATVASMGINPAVYVGITVVGTDLYDWANLQYSMPLWLVFL